MFAIASNLSFKNREFISAARTGNTDWIAGQALALKDAGADMLNISLSLDGDGDEKYIKTAVLGARDAGLPLSIDSRNPKAQEIAAGAAGKKIIVNYFSADYQRVKEMDGILRLAEAAGADLVIYPVRKGIPADADERLAIIEDLIEKANSAGISNSRLIVDPMVLHIAGNVRGQEQAVAVQQTLYGLSELVDPPLRTTCWLSNISAGSDKSVRPAINSTYLAMLAGLGLWSAYVDALDKETMRTVRLIRAFKNETVYSQVDAAA